MNPTEPERSGPPLLPPPVISPPPAPARPPGARRKSIAALLSVFLGLVCAGAILSILDDSCFLLLGHLCVPTLSFLVFALTVLTALVVYALTGLFPLVPKSISLAAVALFVAPPLLLLPILICEYLHWAAFDWLGSWLQLALGLLLLRWTNGSWKFRWPLVAERHFRARPFSWKHLLVFVLLNFLVLAPAVLAYCGGCAGFALSHFSSGFAKLRPYGIVLQARKYARADGRTVILIPMSHIAEPDFYRRVTQAVTSNSVVLLEGVTDDHNLLANKLSYRRSAKALHLAEQHDDLHLEQGTLIRADVDVSDFSTNTIAILNLVTLIHTRGLNAQTLMQLAQFNPPPDVEEALYNDLLLHRNDRLLREFRNQLPHTDTVVIPWGAAHMPGISRAIQQSGFRLAATCNLVSIRFGRLPGASDAQWVPVAESSR